MVHKVTGLHNRGNPAISRSSTAITVGKYTPSSYYTSARTESSRCPPLKSVRMPGGKSARVPKSPPRGT